jgi:hypothetical protein
MTPAGPAPGDYGVEDEVDDADMGFRPPLVVVKHAGKGRRRFSLPVVPSTDALHTENLGVDLGRTLG